MEDAAGINCQATNFSKAVGGIPQVHALGLFDAEDEACTAPPKAYGTLLQAFTRFAIDHMAAEAKAVGSGGNPWLFPTVPVQGGTKPLSTVGQLTGLELTLTNMCLACGTRAGRTSVHHTLDLTYKRKVPFHPSHNSLPSFIELFFSFAKALSNELPTNKDFASILQDSIVRESTTKAVCAQCKQFAPLRTARAVAEGAVLPPVLTLNAALHSGDVLEDVWADKPGKGGKNRFFLPTDLAFFRDPAGEVRVVEGKTGWKKAEATYELRVRFDVFFFLGCP